MINRILRLWWLILAWLLAMFGTDFLKFNAMELFATLAIIGSVIWACIKGRQEKNRKLKQIDFPDEWEAYRLKGQDILKIRIVAEVFLPYQALKLTKAFAEIEGKIIPMQFSLHRGTVATERRIIEGTILLSPISQQAKTIEVSIEIQIDGAIKKSSGKRTISIIDV